MAITQIISTNTLLTYAMSTSPSPVQVSPPSGPPSIAALTFVISRPKVPGETTVTQITFNLPVGAPQSPDAADLTADPRGITCSVTSSGKDAWQINPGAGPGSYVLKPSGPGPGKIDSQGLAVTLANIPVSPAVGTAVVSVVEVASSDGTPAAVQRCDIAVAKFPYGFYAGDFTASTPAVKHGDSAVLSWVGSSLATYTMLWGTESRDVSKVNLWPSPELTDTTTFILEVSAQQSGQTVTLRFSATVIVLDPDLVATSIQVLQGAALQGGATVGTAAAAADLNVTGATRAASAAIAADLAVGGAAALGSAKVAGQLSALGAVAMLGAGQAIAAGVHTNDTDGILFCYVGQDTDNTEKESWARVTVKSGSLQFRVTGGNYIGYMWSTPPYPPVGPMPLSNGLTLPVPKGAGFSIDCDTWGDLLPTVAYVWFPLGTTAPARKMLRKPAKQPSRRARTIKALRPVAAPDPARQVAAVVTALNRALRKTISAADQARVGKALTALLSPAAKPKRSRR